MARYVDADILYQLADEGKTNSFHYANANLTDLSELIEEALYTTADVQEVKRGHWFFTEYDFFDCSVCGEAYYNGCQSPAEARERLKKRYDMYKYCPHCGAKMDGDVK